MSLQPGARLGPYVVVAPLGAGGMGEVYRALDPRLGREVALKVLPAAFARDADRLARFEREVRTVATLSDPHIVAVYDVGRDAEVSYFAAELVEGSDLRRHMSGNRLPLRKVLDLAHQIAAGLAAAHAKGIVHRDLKPENVLVSATGLAKITDFGLAKAALADQTDPTLTEAGTIMGTVAYMSPEQAAGRALDSRSDQFSFGTLLYEMVTGRQAFRRASTAETLAAILQEDPAPIPADLAVPAPLGWVLDRCLAKDPADRYGSTEDLAKDLERIRDRSSSASDGAPAPGPRRRRTWVSALAIAAVACTVVLAYWMGTHRSGPPDRLLRMNIDLPSGVVLAPFSEDKGATLAFSPDGGSIAMVGEHDGRTALYLRALDQSEAQPVPGTAGARGPFFSPDGQWLGFWADGRLRKTPLAGGGPSVICDAVTARGAVWMPDDTIVFSTGFGLLRVPAQGGQPQAITTPDASKGEYSHVSPSRVPGVNALLFSIRYSGEGAQATGVGVLPASGHQWTTLVTGAGEPKFIDPGFLIVNRAGSLQAAPFDPTHLTLTGPFKALEAGAPSTRIEQSISFDVPITGKGLIYSAGQSTAGERALYVVDRQGKAQLLSADRKPYWSPAISPDGTRLAVSVWVDPRVSEVWVLDLVRRSWLRLTTGSNDWEPVWKDRQTLLYTRGRQGGSEAWDEYALPASGNGSPTLLASFPHQVGNHALAPDHGQVVFSTVGKANLDLWLQPLAERAPARPFLVTPADEQTFTQAFAPNGHWLAYSSNATGRNEIYVTDFPGGRDRFPVSTNGGTFPCWSRDGRQIFYWSGSTIMSVNVRAEETFAADTPHALFESPVAAFGEFDVAPDGNRFYIVGSEARQTPSPIVFVSDVSAELESATGRQ